MIIKASKKAVLKSKIICTIGPSSSSKRVLLEMRQKGMSLARINFSHGTREKNGEIIRRIEGLDPQIALLCDIQGPRIRLGEMVEPKHFERGDVLFITAEKIKGDSNRIPITYKSISKEVKKGDMIFMNDGLLSLEVLAIEGRDLKCRVISGGLLSTNKGVNLPSIELSESVPTKKDVLDLEYIAGIDPEYVAISFVGKKADVKKVRAVLDRNGGENIKLVSKIERQKALDNFEEILKESDGIMVARGDLGVETSPESVPQLQKEIIRKCNREGKPVIVATQMLESMIFQPVPTRAEANDVFNAVLDGADAVMLSGETAAGKYPVEAVALMSKIALSAEQVIPRSDPSTYDSMSQSIAELLGHAVYTIVNEFEDQKGKRRLFILTITQSGFSARMISKYRPAVQIFAATPSKKVLGQLNLLWGVKPFLFKSDQDDSTDDLIKKSLKKALKKRLLTKKDYVIILCASSLVKKDTNVLGVFRVEDIMGD